MSISKKNIGRLVCVILFVLTRGCIEPYEPDITKYEDVLVVDATFSDLDKDHIVRLTHSYGYSDDEGSPVNDAVVMIKNDEGKTASYVPHVSAEGVYVLEKGQMTGEIGRSYQLIIITSEGKQYESSFEKLTKPVPIDTVYYELEEDIHNLNGDRFDGVHIYLNSEDQEDETHFYRWDYTETWEVLVPYEKPGYENKRLCWQSESSTDINIANTSQLTEDVVNRRKICFVSTLTSRLSRQYSILVKQYSLSPESYDFWRKLELANEHTGSLFDPPPTPVTGNIENVDDTFEPVLGYFQVSGTSEKRVFISRKDLPREFHLTTGNEHCVSQMITGEAIDELQNGWNLLFRFIYLDSLRTLMTNNINCYNCTLRGVNVKPDYWIDFND